MKLLFGKSHWEMIGQPLDTFLDRVNADGFDAVELCLMFVKEEAAKLNENLKARHLSMVAQVHSRGDSILDHVKSLEQDLNYAAEAGVTLANIHLGKDYFDFETNKQLIDKALSLSESLNIPMVLETHRQRAFFSLPSTLRYVKELPQLRLNADFSHWMVVHESDLKDQQESLECLLPLCRYIHARVGHAEGPQVSDPRGDEWKPWLDRHLELWDRIVSHNRESGTQELIITPEFGPPRYMPTLPHSNQPVADAWEVNLHMKTLLKNRYSKASAV